MKLSSPTLKAAKDLIKTAQAHSLPLDGVLCRPSDDFLLFALSDSLDWVFIYCTPLGHLVHWKEANDDTYEDSYTIVRSLKVFLKHLASRGFEDIGGDIKHLRGLFGMGGIEPL